MEACDASCPQLFLDDSMIEESAFVTRVWHQPRRFADPVLRADRPWEKGCPVLYGTVLKRADRWQMWYCAWTRHCPPRACYAESDDGVSWRKPELGLVDYQGSKENNIILTSRSESGLVDDLTVIEDDQDERAPFKMLFYDNGGGEIPAGIYAAGSVDGIRWTLLSEEPVLRWGDRFNAVPVRLDGRFVIFGRAPDMRTAARGRCVYRAESDDLLRWTEPQLVLARDAEDPPDLQVYSVSTFPYSDLLLGAVERMHMSPDVLDPELVWSRDGGRSWCRSARRPAFIERTVQPSWQDTWINLSASLPILIDQQLWFYYSGRGGAHMSPFPLNQGAIGLACLRQDGFCSLFAAQRPGWVRTRPFRWPGGNLLVNVDPRLDINAHPRHCHGELRVAIEDEQRNSIAGYTAAESDRITSNSVREDGCSHPVRWNGRSADSLRGRTIRLVFKLRQTHLFSFSQSD